MDQVEPEEGVFMATNSGRGPMHADTLASVNKLAGLFYNLGEYIGCTIVP